MASRKTRSRSLYSSEQLCTSDDDSHSITFEATPVKENLVGSLEDLKEAPATQLSNVQQFLSSEDVYNSDDEVQERERRGYRKGTKTANCVFSDEQVAELGEWYRQHPILYDKALRDYRDAVKKFALYERKARSLNPPVTGKACFVVLT